MGRDPPIGAAAPAVAGKDKAQTFAESDVTVSTTDNSRVDAESVKLPVPMETATIDGFSTYNGLEGGCGVVFRAKDLVTEITGTVSGSSSPTYTSAYIETTGGSLVAEKTGLDLSTNDTVTFSGLSLSAGTDYRLVADSGGSTDVDYDGNVPSAGDLANVKDGYYDDPPASTGPAVWSDIEFQNTADGSAYVEWPMAKDVYAWDVAQYLETEDGGTVDVYVEEDQSGGWTEIAGPIARGERIQADANNNVRYRVELARETADANPTLDAIYRRYKL